MTATIDTAPDGVPADDMPQPVVSGASGFAWHPLTPLMIAVVLLTGHPDNVRRDVSLDQEFLDSIAEQGILTPLRITPDSSGGYRVIEGHRGWRPR